MAPTKRTAPAAPRPADSTRPTLREKRRRQSRKEILDAARKVLFRKGIAGTTLEAVAREVGVTKAALYYYFPSKDALFFELIFGSLESQARAVHDAVETSASGAEALGAIVRESVHAFAPRLDDFRLAFLHAQVAGKGAVHFDEKQFERIRPLNELWFAGAVSKLGEDQEARVEQKRVGQERVGQKRVRQERAAQKLVGRARVEPRLLAFLAWLASVGLLTIKGMVENFDDPLLYSDEQIVDGFARVFAAAAER